jgi:hypothetical protein
MAKAGILFVGTGDGLVQYSEPGAMGRWIRVGHALRGMAVRSLWLWADQPLIGLATAGGALYRTQDGGGSWDRVADGPVGLLTGGRAAQAELVCVTAGGQVWRSADAGVGWERNAGALDGQPITHLASSQTDPRQLFAAGGTQVWGSLDGGRSWGEVGSVVQPVDGLAALPDGSVAVVCAGQLVVLGSAIPATPAALPLAGPLAILPGRELTLLAAVSGGILRAHPAADPAVGEVVAADLAWPTGPAALVVAPYHMDTACAGGGSAAAISTDRGRTWLPLRGDLVDVQSIALSRLI